MIVQYYWKCMLLSVYYEYHTKYQLYYKIIFCRFQRNFYLVNQLLPLKSPDTKNIKGVHLNILHVRGFQRWVSRTTSRWKWWQKGRLSAKSRHFCPARSLPPLCFTVPESGSSSYLVTPRYSGKPHQLDKFTEIAKCTVSFWTHK